MLPGPRLPTTAVGLRQRDSQHAPASSLLLVASFEGPVEAGEVSGIDMACHLVRSHFRDQEIPDLAAPFDQLCAEPEFSQPHFHLVLVQGSAVGAVAVEVEAVMDGGESGLRGDIGQALVHQKLNFAVEVDVFDGAAIDAD